MAKLLVVLFIIVALLIGFSIYTSLFESISHTYSSTSDALTNPLMGYAPWFHNIDDIPKDSSLIYVPILWRELEPEEGVFDWDHFENTYHLTELQELGYHLVIRFICDEPSDTPHRDIPDWLYAKTGDGVDYAISYGCGYCPDYSNKDFIKYHKKAVTALGEHFGNSTFISYIELGSVGHWGEWHVKYSDGLPRLPEMVVLAEYVTPWIDAFPNAKLLMRRPFSIAETYQLGIYNDMTGHEEDTKIWLDWINNGGTYSQTGESKAIVPMSQAWKTSPIGGEFTSSISMEKMLVEDLSQTISLLQESHTTFIGPKTASEDYSSGREAVLSAIGYRISISEAHLVYILGQNFLKLTWNNYGIAPMYWDWQVMIYIEDSTGNTLNAIPVDISLTELLPNKSIHTTTKIPGDSLIALLETGDYRISLGIIDPMNGKDSVQLAMDAIYENGRTILFPIQ